MRLTIETLVWPAERLGDALTARTQRAGLSEGASALSNPKPRALSTPPATAQWIECAALNTLNRLTRVAQAAGFYRQLNDAEANTHANLWRRVPIHPDDRETTLCA